VVRELGEGARGHRATHCLPPHLRAPAPEAGLAERRALHGLLALPVHRDVRGPADHLSARALPWPSAREARRKGLDPALVYDFASFGGLAGLVGARLYYVLLSQPGYYLARPLEILAIWHGGLAVHGALLGGLLAGVWFIRRRGLSFWRFADIAAPGLILGQTVGQIACLLNGDTYGKPTTLPWAIPFTDPRAMAPLGVPLHPIEIYELLAYLAAFLLVWRVSQRATQDGAATLAYAVGYGITRFGLEFLRGDPPVMAGIVVPQAISVLLVAAALGAWWARRPARLMPVVRG